MTPEYELFTLMSRIDGMSNQFTKTDWKIVQYMKTRTDKFLTMSAQELAKDIGSSDASVIRFAQKVGYSGLNEMKYAMQRELDHNASASPYADYSLLLHDNKLLLDSLFSLTNPQSIDRLREMMRAAKRIFVVGVDFNSYVADIVAHKFLMLGLDMHALTTYDSLKLYRTLARKDDLFIVITLSGDHKLLSALLGEFKKAGSSIVLLSNYEKSLCATHASLLMQVPKTDLLRSANVISREIIILQLFDMLFNSFLEADKQAAAVFRQTADYFRSDDGDSRDGLRRFFNELL